MERQILQSDYHSTEPPHFDEEWTLLTARPVVPLEKLVTTRTKRRVKLIGLFAAALMLGAVSALAVVSFERSHVVSPVAVGDEEQQPAAPAQEQEAVTSTETNIPDANPSTSTDVAPTTAVKTVAVVHAKTKAAERREEEKPSTPQSDKEANNDVDSSDKPRAVLFDEFRGGWEERRARRIRRQERRAAGGRRGRDLLRIDEIFEGPRP